MTTHETLIEMVKEQARQSAEYFMYSDSYCDAVDCDNEDCDEHFGSVLDIEVTRNMNGDTIGVVVIVGTGGPHIELDTRKHQIIGHWGNDTAYALVDYEVCERVQSHWDM